MLLAACALLQAPRDERLIERSIVIWFESYREVLSGSITIDMPLRLGFVDVKSAVDQLRCVGSATVVKMTPDAEFPEDCTGLEGILGLYCSDGRKMAASWHSGDDCGAGYGRGQDQHENPFHFAYGMTDETARVIVREALADAEGEPPLPTHQESLDARAPSTGTAFFVSHQGHLVTNHHVIDGARRVQIALDEGLVPALVIGEDRRNDLAVLQVEAIRPVLPVRRHSELSKGEEVFTLGYPLVRFQGREQKATFGRVNALTGAEGDDRYTQIDVPIQPGNSGGPLINRRGEVVGVVTAILSPNAALQERGVLPQNVNYAIKSEFLHELLRYTIGAEAIKKAEDRTQRTFQDLVSDAQDSVVIVVAD